MNSYYKMKAKIIRSLERFIDGIYVQDDCVLCGKIIKRKEDLTIIAAAPYGITPGKYHIDCFDKL